MLLCCVPVSDVGLSDPEAKEKYLLSLMESMPEPNHSTVVYLIDHLIRYASYHPVPLFSAANFDKFRGAVCEIL